MSFEIRTEHVAVAQCDWEMADGYGCTHTEHFRMPARLARKAFRILARLHFKKAGWQLEPVVRCQSCVGRRTDVRDETDRFHSFYRCPQCGQEWDDYWDAACNSECGTCRIKDIEPYRYIDTYKEADEESVEEGEIQPAADPETTDRTLPGPG